MGISRIVQVSAQSRLADVRFANGFRGLFVACAPPAGEPRALQTFRLEYGNVTVAQFNSSHQNPIRALPFGFTHLGLRHTPQHVYRYWRAAYDYASEWRRAMPDAWAILELARPDMLEISSGVWPAP